MANTTLKRAYRRFIHEDHRLSKREAIRLRQMILSDCYISKSERTFLTGVLDDGACDDAAFEILLDLLLPNDVRTARLVERRVG